MNGQLYKLGVRDVCFAPGGEGAHAFPAPEVRVQILPPGMKIPKKVNTNTFTDLVGMGETFVSYYSPRALVDVWVFDGARVLSPDLPVPSHVLLGRGDVEIRVALSALGASDRDDPALFFADCMLHETMVDANRMCVQMRFLCMVLPEDTHTALGLIEGLPETQRVQFHGSPEEQLVLADWLMERGDQNQRTLGQMIRGGVLA